MGTRLTRDSQVRRSFAVGLSWPHARDDVEAVSPAALDRDAGKCGLRLHGWHRLLKQRSSRLSALEVTQYPTGLGSPLVEGHNMGPMEKNLTPQRRLDCGAVGGTYIGDMFAAVMGRRTEEERRSIVSASPSSLRLLSS